MRDAPVLLCGTCDQHPCTCYKPIGLTRHELEEFSNMAAETGLRGDGLRAAWLKRTALDDTQDGVHAWTAIKPITKVKSEIKDIILDEYEGQGLDLFYGIHELYQKGAIDYREFRNLIPTSQSRDRIKHLMMIHQIIPMSKRPKNAIPPVVFRKPKRVVMSF